MSIRTGMRIPPSLEMDLTTREKREMEFEKAMIELNNLTVDGKNILLTQVPRIIEIYQAAENANERQTRQDDSTGCPCSHA